MKRSLHRTFIKISTKPKIMTEERYNELLDTVLKDDSEARQEFVLGFVMLTVSVAGTWAAKFPNKQEDIIGAAFLTLMECVDRIVKKQIRRDFSSFSAYVHTRVRGAIINMIRTDYAMKPPANSAWFVKMAKEQGNSVYDEFMGLSSEYSEDDEEQDHHLTLGKVDIHFDFSELELLDSQWFTRDERIALQMRLDGKNHEQIARALALTRSRVTQIFLGMQDRVNQIVKGQV